MAEAVASMALETLRDLLLEEARFLSGVDGEVRQLRKQLEQMTCLLEDAARKRHESKIFVKLTSEVRDLVYEAEAAIERHAAYQVCSRRRRGLRQLIRRYSCTILEDGYSLHQLASEISQIKSDLGSVADKLMLAFGINIIDHGESSAASDNKKKITFPEFEIGDCFVGMEDELKQLRDLLKQDNEERVISVWGMGGSGKTTIAKKLYNETKSSFDLSAWVCISQQCQSFQSVWNDVLKQLEHQSRKGVSDEAQQIREDVTSLSEWELNERLCKIQRDKRCLIVVDDLWKVADWNGLKHPFLVDDLQSKILITTRKEEVAKIGCPVKVGHLKEEDALELLKNKAFPHTNIPDFAFEKIGKEMVQKCGYLPLAISLLGGVLRMKNSMEWELVNEDIKEAIYRDESEIDGVLNLSYESLPYYLKPCFLYMGIFQEDEDINVNDLYHIWIAQGMISYEYIGDKDKTLREIAELYLGELVSRSIVQVEIYDGVTPGSKYNTCKLHDVVRELCLKLGEREDFGVQILEYQSGNLSTLLQQASSNKIRHLAIHFRTREVKLEPVELGEDSSKHLRSLQMFNHSYSDEYPWQRVVNFQKFKLLRDLVMVGFEFARRKLPKEITNLVHLRRLSLKRCEFDKIPLSIRNLVYIDTLDLAASWNVEVPNVFKELVHLKHLILPYYGKENIGSHILTLDEGVVELESLMALDSRVHELKCVNKMKNLRRFDARIFDNERLSAMIDGIAIMDKLSFCRVRIEEGCELGRNEGVLKKAFTCPNLHNLVIQVKLGKALPECCKRDFMSSKLTSLWLSKCEIEDDPMGILGNLPCLTYLYLCWKSFVGEEMTCPSNSFRCLKRLGLSELPKLREWRVEAGAMPLLSELEIYDCSSLKMLPHGLSGISTLRKLEITGMAEMGKRVSASGEDFHKVSHVTSIIIQD
ncbi:putative disease resistance protein At1g50180 [Salvia miltiorrhiza]|uniref:putative disease resistance protein At1g50180 n=1 Tax=Salvia miltiorrhiza TaxID=226208 RepID=UPI0025AC308E|nr:putative disease resistance protein At1g50180 [Salvia miltiorrhiza]XP_057781244.1 putative disease resistance protein At1g50180 [Salvia miltiorrhiza]XP_057781245.1 putative disease resistance protein At1g50180 [Salvia miltiorrhiza]